jgi:hypothetical protein
MGKVKIKEVLGFAAIGLAVLVAGTSFAAGKKTLIVSVGGMGTDGASLASVPNKNSARQAAQLYHALNVAPDEDGVKSAGVQVGDEMFGVVCKQPDAGGGQVHASCEVKSINSVEGDDAPAVLPEMNAVVTFPPAVAKALYGVLPMPKGKQPLGATTKKAGNLTCSKVVYPGAVPKCTIEGVNVMRVSETEFSGAEKAELKKAAKLLGLVNTR